jgi:sulfotransferase family protein
LANIEQIIPDEEAQSNRYLKRVHSPRVIKSHQYFDHRYPKVLYITRDPRDVAFSYYNFCRKYRSSCELTRRDR